MCGWGGGICGWGKGICIVPFKSINRDSVSRTIAVNGEMFARMRKNMKRSSIRLSERTSRSIISDKNIGP